MTNGPVMSLVEMLNSQFPVTKPQPVTEADMTPEEIKLAEIFEAKKAEEARKAAAAEAAKNKNNIQFFFIITLFYSIFLMQISYRILKRN